MDIESAIILIWLLPVLVQIVLPLVMLSGYGIGRLATRVFGDRQSDRKFKVTPADSRRTGCACSGSFDLELIRK